MNKTASKHSMYQHQGNLCKMQCSVVLVCSEILIFIFTATGMQYFTCIKPVQ